MSRVSKANNRHFNVVTAAVFGIVVLTSLFVPASQATDDGLSIEISPIADFLLIDGEQKAVHTVDEPARSEAIDDFRRAVHAINGWGEVKNCEIVLSFEVEFGFENHIVGGSCELTGDNEERLAICRDNVGTKSWSAHPGPISKPELIEFMARECAIPHETISAAGDVMWSNEIAWRIDELADESFRDQLASFRAYVTQAQSGTVLQDCEMILLIPAKGGATGGFAGGLCGLAEDEKIEPVAICANEMVGYMKLRRLGNRVMTRRDLAAYIAYYCTAS